jgi:hypothetical protein
VTDFDDQPFYPVPLTGPNLAAPPPRTCRRHAWDNGVCARCDKVRDPVLTKQNKNNRTRGNREELTVARAVNGQKMGPLGLPWDVEMPGYARLQVKKLAIPPGLRRIAAELTRIGSGAEMPGFVWVEPGRGGEQLIVFRLKDYAERHGVPPVKED